MFYLVLMAWLEELLLFDRTKNSLVRAQPEALSFIVEQLNEESSGVMARQEMLPFFCPNAEFSCHNTAGGAAIFWAS